MRALTPGFLALLTFASCSSGGGGGGEPDPSAEPNEAPALQAPAELSGGPVQYLLSLPTAGSLSLTFTATDADADALQWQVAVSQVGRDACGLSFATPATGTTFTMDVAAVGAPASTPMSVLVEDSRGAAAAIDVLVVRTGAPTISAVSPSAAFATAPQQVEITGSAFSLGDTVNTLVSFGGVAATEVIVESDTLLRCPTPSTGLLGPNAVSVSHQFGSATLPGGSFTMYEYPPNLFAADTALDGGAGLGLVAANDGPSLQAVWIEAGALMHRRSLDAGETWAPAQALSGGETVAEPVVDVVGDDVTVAWVANTGTINVRRSADGGLTFDPVETVAVGALSSNAVQLQLVSSGDRRYLAWIGGSQGLSTARVVSVESADAGATWSDPLAIDDGAAASNQFGFAIDCEGARVWVAFTQGAPAAVFTAYSSDGGILWTAGQRRSVPGSAVIGRPLLAHDGERVFLVWNDGALRYLVSENSAVGWPTQPVELSPPSTPGITSTRIACEDDRLYAVYVYGAAGDTVGFSRVGAAGAAPQQVTLSDVTEPVGAPQLAVAGNYLFAAWRGGAVGGGTGAARVKLATSVDLGTTFDPPATFGDGAVAQDLPRLLLDEARVWLGWLDYRGATASLYQNRTQQ